MNPAHAPVGRLWLVRHAAPQVAPGVCYGALEVPVDPLANEQAARALAPVLPQGVRLCVSPLQRTRQLAQALCTLRPDLRAEVQPHLAEMHFGHHEGQRWDAIDAAALQAWTDDFWHHRFGGVESVAELMTRVAVLWDAAVRSGADQVWLTHAGVMRAVQLLAQGVRRVDAAAQWPQNACAYGQWQRVDLVQGNAPQCGKR